LPAPPRLDEMGMFSRLTKPDLPLDGPSVCWFPSALVGAWDGSPPWPFRAQALAARRREQGRRPRRRPPRRPALQRGVPPRCAVGFGQVNLLPAPKHKQLLAVAGGGREKRR